MKGFRVQVEGEYIARSGIMDKERIVKKYTFECNVPTMYCALSTIKNKMLTPFLARKYPDYVTYRTFNIVNAIPLDEASRKAMKKLEIQYMTRPMLLDYIAENALPVDEKYYPDLFNLRKAVTFAKNDPDTYVKKLNLHRDDLEMDLTLADMNPEVFKEGEKEPDVPASVSTKPYKSPARLQPGTKKLPLKQHSKQTDNRIEGLRKDMIETGEHGETLEDELADI